MTPKSDPIRTLIFILAVATAVATAREMHAKDEVRVTPVESETPEAEVQKGSADPKTAKFEPIPNMPACATGAVVRGNPRSGPAWVYLKLASGCQVPWHWHTPNEDLVAISGQGTLEMRNGPSITIAPGVLAFMPSEHVHRAKCSRTCLFFAISDDAFDIHYVDPMGEEIELEEAMKATVPTPKPKVQKKSQPKKK
jgi:quercetin dioxygenase-like cupin family protein